MKPKNSKKIWWFCVHPTPYIDHMLVAVARAYDIEVTYQKFFLSGYPWKESRKMPFCERAYTSKSPLDVRAMWKVLTNKNDVYVIAGWAHPTNLAILLIASILRRNYIVWTDTPNFEKNRGRVLNSIRSRWLQWIFSRSLAVFTTGKVGCVAVGKLGAPEDKVVNFRTWVNLNLYRRLEPEIASFAGSRKVRILSVGRVNNALKGLDLALEALEQVNHSYTEWIYEIVGTGIDENELRERVRRSELKEKVFFLGWQDAESVAKKQLESDIILHPSPSHDPFPNGVLEGMAAGSVVLASDKCGSAVEWIENGVNGFLHEAGNLKSIVSHLRILFSDQGFMERVQLKAQETAKSFDVASAVKKLDAILQGISNHHPSEVGRIIR